MFSAAKHRSFLATAANKRLVTFFCGSVGECLRVNNKPKLHSSSLSVLNCSWVHNSCNVLHPGRYYSSHQLHWYSFSTRQDFRQYCSVETSSSTLDTSVEVKEKRNLPPGPGLHYFIANNNHFEKGTRNFSKRELEMVSHPYVDVTDINGNGRKVYFDVYGCQMNVSDAELAWSILNKHGYVLTNKRENADVVLVVTCSIREGAEQKVYNKLDYLQGLKNKRSLNKKFVPMKIGVLGCMAERLKKKLVEQERSIDVVAGPDSYRDLPRLLALADGGEAAVNVLLSLEETYADIVPVSLSTNRMSAFVSIMRGCDNMCTYCIVPFTRGRERSRNIESILEEVHYLSDQGIKEITLLGQNVNSYRDTSHVHHAGLSVHDAGDTHLVKGFKTIYKQKKGGLRFAHLLDKVSQVDPEMRIRFTSPHPKDFPDEVLYLVKERENICKHIHLPAQCGSTRILQLMRRGYTREAYCELVTHIRSIIPDVSLSSDFICGFCSETEAEFEETLTLMEEVKYNFCYLFPYSIREKTQAHRKLIDDVPHPVKLDRLQRMIKVFRSEATVINKSQVGQEKLVLVEGTSKRSSSALVGRNDGNTRTPPLPPPMPPPLQVPTTLPPTPSLTGSRPSHHSVW
ncbi:mitochondrial tRNA methylthiotransferase CDK5RAP1 isoform X2 [Cherax quadricarinatus]|uniref:mitochondrial tRNA methylthiotransferase CDK5RAP1 isoform X2 n=1 Tax=Cherax quadricarinatus TaxID=27406 RepID=UPI00387ECA98